ncbi:MAG: flagellar assembly protein J [Candidatus Methanoperedens nitroreducens]|uniref:Flagellar assembly protein J n=1 Tax=Candidatus Methanoperedens nitratireducens TaxID=1392998 RepID=A0A0P7ZD52_9EURY|nr:archaellar assembly protein FlaJ [Candidatus Methanoperedens sp. BLZ2]KAB2944821.1 MAG: archaellar assembly protein FlaJ [Candidatus Methanoperedens sp.]KPQ42608.1 MAG: flagellar assembly protein J [Candidatus Methanoperedens sp. BLZ1]MBZ0177111.1 archaellar assembly protein FlaJ [Candidatus Methanoperedens nitroreducens]MCX9077542.1 archaellar assembly protein FlaJ [Candidatus Methanoperedens sp.]
MNTKVIFHCLGISQKKYFMNFVIPIAILAILFPIIILLLVPSVMEGVLFVGVMLVPIALFSIVIIYPISSLEGKKKEIDNNIHYYITHMGVLATSQMTRVDLLLKLSHTEAYGYLAKETGRIYALIYYWHVSFPVACRFIAQRTPSILFSDFLDRMAHSVQAGQDFREFVLSEQTVVMKDFVTMYQDSLNSIDMIKEMFISMCMSLIFIVAFAIIMPIITGMDSILLLGGAIVLFIGTEFVILLYARSKVPADRIWHTLEIETTADRRIKWSMPVSLLLCIIVTGIVVPFSKLPTTILFATSLTPLLLTGLIARTEENKIKRYDNNFGAFIRSLGGAAGSRSGLILESLKELISHDFGPLSENVNNLYKRLRTRLSTPRSWEHFAAGTGSNLIERFATMFVEGTNVGGKPALIGDIISHNFMSILSMRKLRYSSASSLIGVLYGMTAGIAATMFLAVSIIAMLAKMFSNVSIPDIDIGISIATISATNIPLMTTMLMIMMVCHSLMSAMLIRIVDGGHHFNTYTHFVGLVWISALTAELTIQGMGPLLGM